jgi:hypothetical protein
MSINFKTTNRKHPIGTKIGAYHQNLASFYVGSLTLGGAKDLSGWVGSDVVLQKKEKKKKPKPKP